MAQDLPKTLYHYCNLKGLRGVVENRCLWMTSAFWMDDTTEVFWLYEVAARVLKRYPSESRNSLHERFDKLIKDRRLSYVFCTCFSEDPDSRSQWLEYADNGHGFAIGFDPTSLDLKRAPPRRDVELGSVIYDAAEQERMPEEAIRHLREEGNEVADGLQVLAARHNVWWQAARCKNPKFENEREWRLILRDDPGDGSLKFRERSGRQLVPYTQFSLDPATNPIREIWLGPRNQSQRNIDALAELLRVCGYDVDQVKFRGSKIPLRAEY